MSQTAKKYAGLLTESRPMLEHIDRRGRVRLLALSNEAHKFYAGGMMGRAEQKPAVANDSRDNRNALTARECQVFDLLICGLSNKQMAHELAISARTVEIHRARILQKMGVRNTASLIRIAMTAG